MLEGNRTSPLSERKLEVGSQAKEPNPLVEDEDPSDTEKGYAEGSSAPIVEVDTGGVSQEEVRELIKVHRTELKDIQRKVKIEEIKKEKRGGAKDEKVFAQLQ